MKPKTYLFPGTVNNWRATPDPTCEAPQVLQFKPVIWTKREVQELPTFPGDPEGFAGPINDHGQAVGASGNCTTEGFHALLWQEGSVTDLGNLGGTMGNIAIDINNQGQVVGRSNLPGDTTFHAFLWQNGVMTDLGTLPGDVASAAIGINSKGQVVGGSFDIDGNGRAFLWQNGVMTDLNTLIPADSPLFLLEAVGTINSRGEIAGGALQTSTGEIHGFLATPSNGEVASETAAPAARGQTRQARRSSCLRMFARCFGSAWTIVITFPASKPGQRNSCGGVTTIVSGARRW
jgi:probable HAF family extracellular repeat protein